MTNEQVLAKAILELARKAAVTWDYDGEEMHATGLDLSMKRELERIAEGKTEKP